MVRSRRLLHVTLNLRTSSILAVLPSLTQLWKNEGATDTPRASLVIPVCARSQFTATTLNVPNSSTNNRCVYIGMEVINLRSVNFPLWSRWNDRMRNACQSREIITCVSGPVVVLRYLVGLWQTVVALPLYRISHQVSCAKIFSGRWLWCKRWSYPYWPDVRFAGNVPVSSCYPGGQALERYLFWVGLPYSISI